MIEYLWQFVQELWSFLAQNFDPARDIFDIAIVTLGIYWLLLLIRGTRAIQILVGLIVLMALMLASELFQFATLGLILDNFMGSAVLIIIVLFQHDIRRALARVGRGFFPAVSTQQETQLVEEVVRAAQALAERQVGALIVLERETALGDQIEAGPRIDASVSMELLLSIFLPPSPLHDGAAVIQEGRITSVGSILPLTLRGDLPEGAGTRHRAALGVTEETDAVVVVVSEETGAISVVMGGEMMRDVDPPRLRALLRDILAGDRRELPRTSEAPRPVGVSEVPERGEGATRSRSVG